VPIQPPHFAMKGFDVATSPETPLALATKATDD
jgi:hypothetical protein